MNYSGNKQLLDFVVYHRILKKLLSQNKKVFAN